MRRTDRAPYKPNRQSVSRGGQYSVVVFSCCVIGCVCSPLFIVLAVSIVFSCLVCLCVLACLFVFLDCPWHPNQMNTPFYVCVLHHRICFEKQWLSNAHRTLRLHAYSIYKSQPPRLPAPPAAYQPPASRLPEACQQPANCLLTAWHSPPRADGSSQLLEAPTQ